MAQAKGVLPTRREDREVLYKNPRTCGYFVAAKLDPTIDRARLEALLGSFDRLITELVARDEDGTKRASVAVGFAPSFFALNIEPRLEPPAAFRSAFPAPAQGQPEVPNPLPQVPAAGIEADVLFYVASVFEARVNKFVSDLAALRPEVQSLALDRGYQRMDETEPFGYADGVRNVVPAEDRSRHVFIHRDERELEEPRFADGGTYMAFMRIVQNPDTFASFGDDQARDNAIGRRKDGTRLDLAAEDIHPRKEPAEPVPNLAANSHVRKAGPRGRHDDAQIFRRGLPFMDVAGGQLRVGLNFCSFQASLDQFDVVFGDWIMNPHFPVQGAGVDVLLDPARGITQIEKVGFFFVPPYHSAGIGAALFAPGEGTRRPKTGRLVVRKRVQDSTDAGRRFERGGFVFQVLDAQGQPVGGQFSSDSTGRALAPEELTIGNPYTLQEVSAPVQNVQLQSFAFDMDRVHKELVVVNHVTQPNTPYGQ